MDDLGYRGEGAESKIGQGLAKELAEPAVPGGRCIHILRSELFGGFVVLTRALQVIAGGISLAPGGELRAQQ